MKIYKSKIPTIIAISLILIAFCVFSLYCFEYKQTVLECKIIVFGLLLVTLVCLVIDWFSNHLLYNFTDDGVIDCLNKSEISWQLISDFKTKIVIERFAVPYVFLILYTDNSKILTSLQLNSLECNLEEIELFLQNKIKERSF
jgi:hypothetical protein